MLDLSPLWDGLASIRTLNEFISNVLFDRIDDNLLSEVNEKGKYLFDTFNGTAGIESVSGMGLMIGIKTVRPASEVVAECMDKGVLCLTAKDKVRLLPALNIPMSLLKKAAEIIKTVCADV